MRLGRLFAQVVLSCGLFASAAAAQQQCMNLISESDRSALEVFVKNLRASGAVLRELGEGNPDGSGARHRGYSSQ
jgi:hypothetical protein